MIYVKKDSSFEQRIFIPREVRLGSGDVTGTTQALQEKNYSFGQNGRYEINPDAGYAGISGGTIEVNVQGTGSTYNEGFSDGFESGYASGETHGIQVQKSRLSSTELTDNGTYTREDGWSAVTVSVPQTGYTQADIDNAYASGYTSGEEDGFIEGFSSGQTDGAAAQKALLSSTGFTENGEYSVENGWSAVTVQVPHTGYTQTDLDNAYASGVTDGEATQKALLGSTSFTQNNTYTNVNGWSAVTVNVSGGSGSSLTSETFTSNGNYSPVGVDGWSAITVNVSSGIGTNIPLTAVTSQEFAANSDTTYQFIRTSADTLHRLVITFPTSGTTKVTAKYYPQDDGEVKLYSILPVNSITIDGGAPIGPTTSVTMTAGEHNVVFDCSRDDLWGNLASFLDCTDLTEINLNGAYVETMPDFQGCTRLYKIEAERCEIVDHYRCWKTSIDMLSREYTPLLKKVGGDSFKDCQNLQHSYLFLTEIGFGAFSGCSILSSVELRSATTIGNQAFNGCALELVELHNECTVGSLAFKNCPLTDGVSFVNDKTRTIYYNAFSGCTGMTRIYSFDGARPPIVVDDGGQTSNALVGVPASGTIGVSTTSVIQDWTTWAATYLPNWSVVEYH